MRVKEILARSSKTQPQAKVSMKMALALNKKALSPIFATLVILAVVTVLFIPVFIWATGATSQTEDSWLKLGQISTERIVIEAVSLSLAGNQVTIYVRNIGKTAVSINDVLIEDSANKIITYQGSELETLIPGTTTIDNDPIVQGELIAVKIDDLKGLNPVSKSYLVKVFTPRGVGESYELKG